MNRLKKRIIVAFIAMVGMKAFADENTAINFASKQLAPGLYMLEGVGGFTGGNIGLSVGEDGVVMIDDSMPPFLDKLNAHIKSIAKKPIDFLINTHVHGDHTGNNEAYGKSGAHIVAHQNLRAHLLKKGVRGNKGMQPAPASALPVITFSEQMNFYLNGDDVHLMHLPKAHTDGDAVIYFKKANVIHMGDLFFNGLFPFIDLSSGGDVRGYIAAQKKILNMIDDKTKIIPGHGPLATKKDLSVTAAMIEDSSRMIAALIKKGKTEKEVVTLNPLSKYHKKWNWGFITTEKMTRQVYKSLKHQHDHDHHTDHHH